jgi:hypothetical protein
MDARVGDLDHQIGLEQRSAAEFRRHLGTVGDDHLLEERAAHRLRIVEALLHGLVGQASLVADDASVQRARPDGP